MRLLAVEPKKIEVAAIGCLQHRLAKEPIVPAQRGLVAVDRFGTTRIQLSLIDKQI